MKNLIFKLEKMQEENTSSQKIDVKLLERVLIINVFYVNNYNIIVNILLDDFFLFMCI